MQRSNKNTLSSVPFRWWSGGSCWRSSLGILRSSPITWYPPYRNVQQRKMPQQRKTSCTTYLTNCGQKNISMENQDEGGSWEKYEDVSYLMIESIGELLNYFPKYVNYYLHCKKFLMGWTQTDFKLHLHDRLFFINPLDLPPPHKVLLDKVNFELCKLLLYH